MGNLTSSEVIMVYYRWEVVPAVVAVSGALFLSNLLLGGVMAIKSCCKLECCQPCKSRCKSCSCCKQCTTKCCEPCISCYSLSCCRSCKSTEKSCITAPEGCKKCCEHFCTLYYKFLEGIIITVFRVAVTKQGVSRECTEYR